MSNNETTDDVIGGVRSIEDARKQNDGTTLGSTSPTRDRRTRLVTRKLFLMKRKGSIISTTDEEDEDNDDDDSYQDDKNNYNMNDINTNKHEVYNEIFRDSSGYGSPLFASLPVGLALTEPNIMADNCHPTRTSPPSLPSLPFLNQNSKSPHRQHQQRIHQRYNHHHYAGRQHQLQQKPELQLGEEDNEKQQQQHYSQQEQLQRNEQCDTVGILSTTPNRRNMLQRQTSSKRNLWWQQSIVRRTVSFVQDEVERIISNSPYLRTHAQQAIPVAGLDQYDDDDENDSPCSPPLQQQQGIALFHRSEIQTGQCLGHGGFSVVYEISGFVLSDDVSDRMTCKQQALREEYVRTCLDPITKCPRYAIKYLKESLFLKSSTNDPFPQAGRTATSSVTTAGTPPVPRTNSTTATMITGTPVGTKSIVSCSFENGGCNAPKYYGTRSKQSSLMMIPPESPVVAKNKYQSFQNASLDLAIEAAYMSSFDHPNIMKVRGLPVDGYQALSDGNHDGYFIVMDKLTTTLDAKIHTVWKPHEQSQENNHDVSYLARMHEKATCALQLAEALDHLHTKGILFRDVKPHNIGFVADQDSERLVLFDFGLCREIPVDTHATLSFRNSDDCETDEDETESGASSQYKLRQDRTRSSMETETSSQLPIYRMSGGVGTRRYMAPEVATGSRYNTKADVYSWAMVVWEMISLNKPYPEYTAEEHKLHVCQEGERPQFRTTIEPTTTDAWQLPILPVEMEDLLRLTWEQDINQRLSMNDVCERLSSLLRLLEQYREQLSNFYVNDENSCVCVLATSETTTKESCKSQPFPGSPTTVCFDPERIVRVEDLSPPNSKLSFPTNGEQINPDWDCHPTASSATATATNDGGICNNSSSIELLADRFFYFLRLPLLRIPSFYSNVLEHPALQPKGENDNVIHQK